VKEWIRNPGSLDETSVQLCPAHNGALATQVAVSYDPILQSTSQCLQSRSNRLSSICPLGLHSYSLCIELFGGKNGAGRRFIELHTALRLFWK